MGGKVLELETERLERLRREAVVEGERRGEIRGEIRGEKRGEERLGVLINRLISGMTRE